MYPRFRTQDSFYSFRFDSTEAVMTGWSCTYFRPFFLPSFHSLAPTLSLIYLSIDGSIQYSAHHSIILSNGNDETSTRQKQKQTKGDSLINFHSWKSRHHWLAGWSRTFSFPTYFRASILAFMALEYSAYGSFVLLVHSMNG